MSELHNRMSDEEFNALWNERMGEAAKAMRSGPICPRRHCWLGRWPAPLFMPCISCAALHTMAHHPARHSRAMGERESAGRGDRKRDSRQHQVFHHSAPRLEVPEA